MAIIGTASNSVRLLAVSVLLLELEFEILKMFLLINTLMMLYLLLEILRLILGVSLDALMTRVLLACPNF